MKRIIGLVIIALIALVGLSSVYIVNEDEVAIVRQFGEKVAVVIAVEDEDVVRQNLEASGKNLKIYTTKGMHFKLPYVQSVEKYSSKYMTYQSNKEKINTNDGRRIRIQMYAQYRIKDPVVFMDAVRTQSNAATRMDENVYKTVINSANTLEFNEFFYQNTLEDLLAQKMEALNTDLTKELGLYVSDIGINYKSFPDTNISNIEEKMSKEIQKDSEKLIAEGDSEYLQAQATTDRQKSEIISQAREDAAVIKANADAEAIRIYQDSLQKDLSFYRFIKRMEIYKNVKDATIFLDNDNAIFDYIDGYGPSAADQ